MKNMLEVHYLFEQIDVGLNRDEIYWYSSIVSMYI